MIDYAYYGNYRRINWKNYDNTDTPLNADNLNLMDATIEQHDKALTSQGEAMAGLDYEMRNLSRTVTTFDSRISNNTNRINSLTTKVATAESNITSIQSDIQEIQDEIEHLDLKTNFADLQDVELTNLQDGDVPIYDSTSQKWKNGKADIGLFVENGLLMCRYSV